MNDEWRICVKENQRHAKKERVDMQKRLNEATEDRSWVEEVLFDTEK